MTGPDRRPPLVDLHCHFVPGVDDGAPDLDHALRYLDEGLSAGVEQVVTTPHLPASRSDAPLRRRIVERFRDLEDAARERVPGVELGLAYEIRLDGGALDPDDRRLWLGPAGHILVEYDRFRVPSEPMAPVRPLLEAGLTPVLAHPERYTNAGDGAWMEPLRQAGVELCPNAVSLTGRNGPGPARLSRELLASGRARLLASDHHARPDRSYGLGRVWEFLAERGAQEAARTLMSDNPRAVLEGRPTERVPGAVVGEPVGGDVRPGPSRGGLE